MSEQFLAERRPGEVMCRALAALYPENPFSTPAYAAVRIAAGAEPWIVGLGAGGALSAGCYGFIARGRLNSRFEIHSLPSLPQPSAFWEGVVGFCRDQKITDLHINSFGSSEAAIPDLTVDMQRRARREYHLALQASPLWKSISSNHKRNIKRAKKAGLGVELRRDPTAVEAHALSITKSMSRRASRGEEVSTTADARPYNALLECGVGQLFQATREEEVMSSLLVLRATRGAYYHSAGSSPEGMASGAAHFLIAEVAERLSDEGLEVFNLGGADPEQEGLARFKAGFGAHQLDLEAARLAVCSPIRRYFYALQRALGTAD